MNCLDKIHEIIRVIEGKDILSAIIKAYHIEERKLSIEDIKVYAYKEK